MIPKEIVRDFLCFAGHFIFLIYNKLRFFELFSLFLQFCYCFIPEFVYNICVCFRQVMSLKTTRKEIFHEKTTLS